MDVKNEEHERPEKKFGDTELHTIVKDYFLSAKQMAKIVNVSQQTISSHLKAMGKSHKLGKRMSQELTDKGKTEKSLENFICKDTIDNHRCIEFILTMFPDLFSVC